MMFLAVYTVLAIFGTTLAADPKWCVTSVNAKAKCEQVKTAIAGGLACVTGTDEKDCYKKIIDKQADFGVFDGGMVYQAGREHDLRAIMAEKLANVTGAATAYYAVAVVKATSTGLTINNLKGTKSCHTGVKKTSGWIIPVGTLLRKNLMKWVNCDQYASVAAYFNASCAPGANDAKYNAKKAGATKLCSLCSGTGADKCSRSSKEPYYSYAGAFKCLKDGAGDVAFIKASILTALTTAEQAKYKLLCPDGTQADPKDYVKCNLARVSSHAVLARKDAPIASYQAVLKKADRLLGEKTSNAVKLYDGVLFSKGTVGLDEVAGDRQNYAKYLDTAYINDVSAFESCGVKWCVTSAAANARCEAVNKGIGAGMTCVMGKDEKDCYTKIVNKQADIGVFDGGMIYKAGKDHGLKAIMAENLKGVGTNATAYYAVAAVKTTSSSLNMNNLKGKKSCHTGVRKTSGWIVPVGTLLRKKLMTWKNCDEYASVAAYFSASCAPGANDMKYNAKKAGATKLCSLCSGTGADKCSRSSKEPYYSYAGAFKCLKDGAGDVAFIKASILTALTTADQAKYKLLCLDGKKADPKDFKTCNLARVPSHAVLARKDAPIAGYQSLLAKVDKFLSNPSSATKYGNGSLFSKNTVSLAMVDTAKQSYDKYLDTAYMKDLSAFDSCVKAGASSLQTNLWALAIVLFVYKLFV